MANGTLPAYLASAKPNPTTNRGPWWTNTAPAYFGIFTWIAFYDKLGTSFKYGGLDAALGGLVIAAVICHFLYHYVFGLLGMRTGYPLYVVGSSTFGTKGGFLFPGIFMGLLQIGWYSVGTFYATKLMLGAFNVKALTVLDPEVANRGFSLLFLIVAIAWGYIFALFGAFGIKYVAKMSSYLPWVAVAMLVIAAVCGLPQIGKIQVAKAGPGSLAAACLVIQMVIGFFATAGAAGVDFGTNSRDANDVNMGGLTGITMGIVLTGGLALVAVAGAQGLEPSGEPTMFASLPVVSPGLAKIMLLLFAIGSMAPSCFCSSIIGNSLSTMIPSIGRVPLTLGGATIGIILAATGVAGNLESFFGLIGASFGPICGAILADYFLSGRKWAGPRGGVSIAGYAAWVIGFLVGISNNGMVTKLLNRELLPDWHPTALYSLIVGFVVYAILAKAGLQGKTVAYPGADTSK
ncbi:MAG: cytosine permease [Phycisphaerae bacterium]|nr:cytosine permease [Phycisphaerae bacterium]